MSGGLYLAEHHEELMRFMMSVARSSLTPASTIFSEKSIGCCPIPTVGNDPPGRPGASLAGTYVGDEIDRVFRILGALA